jgi:hypothetical protein
MAYKWSIHITDKTCYNLIGSAAYHDIITSQSFGRIGILNFDWLKNWPIKGFTFGGSSLIG